MKKILFVWMGSLLGFVSTAAYSEKGEYWEITSKMEMPGMPFAMPANTNKVCLPPGGEKDPQRTHDKDSKCTFTDVKHSGNTVKYKGSCVNSRGDTMNMEGETTHDSNSFKTNMKMSSESRGRTMNMTMIGSGKRVGGSCDTEEMVKKAQEQKQQIDKKMEENRAKSCDISRQGSLESSAQLYTGPYITCSNTKEYCQSVRDKTQRDMEGLEELLSYEAGAGHMSESMKKEGGKEVSYSIAKICNIDVTSLKKTACKDLVHKLPEHSKKLRRDNTRFIDEYCSPAEAKEYHELVRLEARRKNCEGRVYTSDPNWTKKYDSCMAGNMPADETTESDTGSSSNNADSRKSQSAKQKADAEKSDSSSTTGNPAADSVLEGAKKLKGLFKF